MFYQCQRCGNCCRWPGFVRLTEGDAQEISHFLNMEVTDFVERYTEINPNRSSLVLKNKANGECIFLDGMNTCIVNKVKPFQCKGFPNTWNFPKWRDVCEAKPVEIEVRIKS